MAITTLKIRKGKKKSTIYLFVQNGREFRIRQSTNISIPSQSLKYWNDKVGRIKNLSDISNSEWINDKLSELIKNVDSGIRLLHDENSLDKLNCKKLIENLINPNEDNSYRNNIFKNEKLKSVCYYFDWYTEYYSENPSPNSKNVLTKGTLRTYKNSKSFLEKYLKSRKIKIEDFTFNNVNREFYFDLLDYGKSEKVSKNYIGTIIQKLKTIIGSAYENEVHNNNEFKKLYFAKQTEISDNIYLNNNELLKFSNVKLNSPFLDDVRDIFLISCYTGMRVGDLESFLKNPEKVVKESNGKKFLYYTQEKTKGEVEIPLKNEIIQILSKRNGKFPNYINKGKLNEFIKIIGKRAGIVAPFEKTITKGGKEIKTTSPKYKFIVMHTGRRSFCTNAYLEGVPLQFIMYASGHKSEKVLLKYIKASATEKAKKLSEFDFFN